MGGAGGGRMGVRYISEGKFIDPSANYVNNRLVQILLFSKFPEFKYLSSFYPHNSFVSAAKVICLLALQHTLREGFCYV